jgi:hypothetical protein
MLRRMFAKTRVSGSTTSLFVTRVNSALTEHELEHDEEREADVEERGPPVHQPDVELRRHAHTGAGPASTPQSPLRNER